MKRLLYRGVWLGLALMSLAGGVCAQQKYEKFGDPVGHESPAPLKIVAVDEGSAPAGWKRFQFGEPVLFSALLPGPPEGRDERVEGSDGAMIVRAYYAGSGTAVYEIIYGTYLPDMAEAKTEEQQQMAFKNFIYGFAAGVRKSRPENENTQFQITTERAATVGGVKGYEKEFTLGAYHGRAQMAFQDKQRVTLICLWVEKNPAVERASFFSSFRLNPQR